VAVRAIFLFPVQMSWARRSGEGTDTMVRTSTAEQNHYICPRCRDALCRDRSGRGYVAHKNNSTCRFEEGERDDFTQWRQSNNDDHGSLFTGKVQLKQGATILIKDEGRERTVTYVMGSERNGWHACFKNQGAVPVGEIEWRILGFENAAENATVRRRHFDFHTAKGVVEFAAAIAGIGGAIGGFLAWVVS
jgi:hypothetical protein